jgi:hypothetical protein
MYCNHIDLIALQYHLYKITLSLQILKNWNKNSDHTKEYIYIYIYKRFSLESFAKLGYKYVDVSFLEKFHTIVTKKKGSCDSLNNFLRVKMAPSLSYFEEKIFEFVIFKL